MNDTKMKLLLLLNFIDEALEKIPSSDAFRLEYTPPISIYYEIDELTNILLKLEKDEQILQVLNFPSTQGDNYENQKDVYWQIKLNPKQYEVFIKKIQIESDYWKFPAIQKDRRLKESEGLSAKGNVIYNVSYTAANEILLNDIFLLHRTHNDMENDSVFDFLYQNPNKSFTKSEIEQEINREITKSFDKIVENLGFSGDIRKVFFGKVGKNSIRFNNPVTKGMLQDLGIDKINLGSKSQK